MIYQYKRLLAAICLCAFLLSFSSCTGNLPAKEEALHIITTNYALYDFASAVCGEDATVTMLLPPGAESHDYEVTLKDMAALESCDLLFFVGGESEGWVYDALHTIEEYSAGPQTLSAMSLLQDAGMLLGETGAIADTAKDHQDHDHGHDHGHSDAFAGLDEHIWTSIPNAVYLMNALDDALSALDEKYPAGNHNDYITALTALDEKFHALCANTTDPSIIVADRFPFLYMAEEYGIEYYAAFDGCSSDTEPSMYVVDKLISLTAEKGMNTLFVIEFSDRRTAERIAAETGVSIAELHSCHNVSVEDFNSGITYLELMERNYVALETAWTQKESPVI